MRMLARLIVMWLIAVALPIQGMAAATMLHCGQAEHSAQAREHAREHEQGRGHEHHAKHGHTSADKASCSACASCCSAAALPTLPLIVASQEPSTTASPELTDPVVVFLTDGPERPPRSVLG